VRTLRGGLRRRRADSDPSADRQPGPNRYRQPGPNHYRQPGPNRFRQPGPNRYRPESATGGAHTSSHPGWPWTVRHC
jgi:hypothetical protein